uniref:CCHC-type domain-containing protein n=1 Tax=Chenopodium quinoa TaxID=63459 RepID=A0A803MPC6_CHEQI
MKLKSDGVRDLILSESARRRVFGESSGEAYAFESMGRGRQQGGSASHHGRSKSRGSGRSNANVLCWGCGSEGHVKKIFPKIKKKGKGKSHGSDKDEDASTNSVTEHDLDALCVARSAPRMLGFLISDLRFILLHWRYECEAQKWWFVGVEDLKDVMYIPKLKKSLISVSKLDKAGYKVVFERGSWRIVKGALVEAHGTLNGSLYTLESTSECSENKEMMLIRGWMRPRFCFLGRKEVWILASIACDVDSRVCLIAFLVKRKCLYQGSGWCALEIDDDDVVFIGCVQCDLLEITVF